MNDFAIKNYHSNKSSLTTKVKSVAFAVLVIVTLCSGLATVCEVGHVMQMERIAAATN